MKKTALLLTIIVAAVVLAGCTAAVHTGRETARDTVRAHYDYRESWSPALGCYGKVTGYAYNAGNATVDDVALAFNLVDTRTGTIRDSRSVFIGTMGAGQSGTFETTLDGECAQDYRVDAAILK